MRLRQRMQRLYPLRVREVAVADLRLDVTVVADPDRVLMDMEQGIQATGYDAPRWQPYWAESWESAAAVGETIASWPLRDRQVLDLGCGVGVAGIVAAACEARVVLADAAHPALLFARYNAWPWRERVQVRRIDWRVDRLRQSFDLLLGADILYDPADWPYLDSFFRAHLAPGGQVLIGEPGRRGADEFPTWSQAHGWKLVDTFTYRCADRPKPLRLWLMQPT